MNARLSLPIAALLLLAAVPPSLPAAAQAPAPAGCAGFAQTIQADTFTVDAGTTRVLADSTAIIATRVVVLGRLTTTDALPGQDAPDLCIQAETLDVLGAITTGNGHQGLNDYNATLALGGAGTNGGDLTLNLVDNPRTLILPALNIGVGGLVATGNGGTGGTALTTDPCALIPNANLIAFTSPCPSLRCSLVTTLLPPGRSDLCDVPNPEGIDCHALIDLLPGEWRVDPCPGDGIHLPDCTAAFTLLGGDVNGDCGDIGNPTLPSCEQLTRLLTLSSLVCVTGDDLTPCTGNPVRPTVTATGGNGGDAGTLNLASSSPLALDTVPTGLFFIGRGGDGGPALVATGNAASERAATGGAGGQSLMLYQGQTMPDPQAVAWLTAHPPASSAGGNGGAATVQGADFSTFDLCRTIQYCLNQVLGGEAVCPIPVPTCDNTNQTTYRVLRCLVQGLVGECGGPGLPPDGYPAVGCPGEPGTEYSGNGGSGAEGASGEAGSAGADMTVQIGAKGADGSAGCTGSVRHGGTGWPGEDGGPGAPSHATGGPGGRGFLVGGRGGDASMRGSNGGNGGHGGLGGDGAGGPAVCGGFAHPGGGGNGGTGGASGAGTATGGAGGGAMLFAGDGGNAEATPGKAGVGGVGGSTGAPGVYCWDICVTDPQLGPWGCGGLNGLVTPVLMVGGAKGVGGVNGRPGKPDPPGTHDPPSQPSPVHNAHGVGWPQHCPFP